MKKFGILLVAVALIAGMVGCTGSVSYALVIASTEGGSVSSPGEGMFTHNEGTLVYLVATPDADYGFANWTGNVSTIANVNEPATFITMNDNYFITANFELMANRPPTINSLTVNATSVALFDSLNVTCDASDPNDDELSYEWTTSRGHVTGTGPEVVWTAIQIGTFNITVVVEDGRGGSATSTLDIDVVHGHLPKANLELEQVISASIDYLLDYYMWPMDSNDLVNAGYISVELHAVYCFDVAYGWVLTATNLGWSYAIEFSPGIAGYYGIHGKWVMAL